MWHNFCLVFKYNTKKLISPWCNWGIGFYFIFFHPPVMLFEYFRVELVNNSWTTYPIFHMTECPRASFETCLLIRQMSYKEILGSLHLLSAWQVQTAGRREGDPRVKLRIVNEPEMLLFYGPVTQKHKTTKIYLSNAYSHHWVEIWVTRLAHIKRRSKRIRFNF